ncbi:MAG: 5-formyltetrahydrofolate cyclo-ligase [Candidatus Cyclobacteriaceae bacterium M2_1C_046]
MVNKKVLREVYLEKRLTLTQDEYQRRNEMLLQNILDNIDFSGLRFIHIFISIVKQKEVDTAPIIKKVKSTYPDVHFAVSKTLPERQLEHFLLTEETTLKTSSWGIPEPHAGDKIVPEDVDLIFVPLISFDKSGHRIGYGGGYYDVFLQQAPKAKKIGLSLSPSLDYIDFVEEFDIPLDGCITPFEIFEFKP